MLRKSHLVAILKCIATLAPIVSTGALAQTMPNLESCTQWNSESNRIGFWNKCGQPVVVLLMQFDTHRPIKREIKPNARFDTGRTQAQLHATGWMSTRCPVGFVPSVPFRFENRDAIIASKYTCVKK